MSEDAHESMTIHFPAAMGKTRSAGQLVKDQLITELDTAILLLEHARAFAHAGDIKLAEQSIATVRNRLKMISGELAPPSVMT